MHICLVSTFPPTPCGIATYCSYLIDGLLSVDMKLHITVLAESPVANDLRARLHVIDAFSRDSDYGPPILQQVRACAPDVVHVQHEYGIFGFDGRFLRLLAGLRECVFRLSLRCTRYIRDPAWTSAAPGERTKGSPLAWTSKESSGSCANCPI